MNRRHNFINLKMHWCLILLVLIAFAFGGYLYKDLKDRRKIEKLTKPSNFLKTKGYFQKDLIENFDNALFQGASSTSISYLHFDEPSYTDVDARFSGTQLSSNQAIIVKGVHDLKYFSLTALDEDNEMFDTFVPKANEMFAFVVLRSKNVKKKLEKILKDYNQFYIFIGDSYPFSKLVSVVAEKIAGPVNSETKLISEKCTLISLYPQITTEVEREVRDIEQETDFSKNKFESFLREFFYKNHSIEKNITLNQIQGNFGYSLRQISEPLEFNKNTYINFMTTKRLSEQIQIGLIDDCNRVVTSTELGNFSRRTKEIDGESIIEMEIVPKITGQYKFFSGHFSDLAIMKPLSVSFIGTKYGKI